ncbi:MAG TPA: hypothetical protein VMA34_01145 [Terracidiphilus sp.]|nr:hypothetical protein [Terracidiphilus sp.]
MRRVARRGFLQKKVYPVLGLYPWECGACREVTMVRKRYQRKRSSQPGAVQEEPQ